MKAINLTTPNQFKLRKTTIAKLNGIEMARSSDVNGFADTPTVTTTSSVIFANILS